jgi:hypothetical protein
MPSRADSDNPVGGYRPLTLDDIMATRPCNDWPRTRIESLWPTDGQVTVRTLADAVAVPYHNRLLTLVRMLSVPDRVVFAQECADWAADWAASTYVEHAAKAHATAANGWARRATERAAFAAKWAAADAYAVAEHATYAAQAAVSAWARRAACTVEGDGWREWTAYYCARDCARERILDRLCRRLSATEETTQ